MTKQNTISISLATALYGFVALFFLLFGLLTGKIIYDRTEAVQHTALAEAVEVRGSHAALDFARTLNVDWQNLKNIGERLALNDPAALRAALDMTVGNGTRVSWAGYATPNGRVASSSNDVLSEADVSARPWFQRGLSGQFAGDVHEAVLLNRILGGTEEEPLRFIDLAAQVLGPDGAVAGVLGFHINFAWAEDYLTETARSLDVDLFLVDQVGNVIIATDGSATGSSSLEVFRAAAAGVAHSDSEVWPDGETYFTQVVPQVTYGDLPSFGWRLVARISPETFDAARTELRLEILIVLGAAGLFLLMLTVLFNRIFLRPVADLAANAQRIAAGADDYPMENRSSAEVATLSAALATLQGRRG
ncbi:cache domain-containing protein [Szabonella alba]|uniref:Cache and HAMP domain-containing protein n=1 Tax=Szabonella alba TaxID=2804194 RepID=A0A8K0VFM1_9RHOB|nr:cache and HAMP domain-containing protein [Szabonella alba]MBL4918779.1 cache and HAMP domain-containing protein [Szabonella alba]